MNETLASKLVNENNELLNTIYQYNNSIRTMKKQIRENEKIIYKNCSHDWEYDESCGQYDRIKYKCKNCGLWRNHYMYS
jgi:hypothetical protein